VNKAYIKGISDKEKFCGEGDRSVNIGCIQCWPIKSEKG